MSAITDFYKNRDIFLTGVTGYVGKALVEKLLHSVQHCGNIYVLIRGKNGVDPMQRLEKVLQSKIFDRVRYECPEQLLKVKAVDGNLLDDDLNLNESDMLTLCNTVSVVFHCACDVRLEEKLQTLLTTNVEGVRRVITICKQMKQLVSLVYVSTAYANCDQSLVKECIYPTSVKPKTLADLSKAISNDMMECLSSELIGNKPNTYTFSKALAENVCQEYAEKLPIIIVRPSQIGPCWKEPIPGYIDNWYGVTSLIITSGKGLLPHYPSDKTAILDIIPLDIVVNSIIVSAFHRANKNHMKNMSPIPVVNVCSGSINPVTLGAATELVIQGLKKYPFKQTFQTPCFKYYEKFYESNSIWMDIYNFCYFTVPVHITDWILWISGKKPKMVHIYSKIWTAVQAYRKFNHTHHFEYKSIPLLQSHMQSDDMQTFYINVSDLDWSNYFDKYVFGVRQHILNEDDDNRNK